MLNIVIKPIKEEAAATKVLEAPDGWVIMHASFGPDQASQNSAEKQPSSGASRT